MPTVSDLTFTDRALAAVRRGFSIVPVAPRDKYPLRGAKSRTNTEDGVRQFASQVPVNANYGIVADSRFTILETDDHAKFVSALGKPVPPTFSVSATPNRGYWVFEQTDKTRTIKKNLEWEGVFEHRHINEYCVGPGSIHASGREYVIVRDVEPIPMPDWLVDKLQELYRAAPISTKPGVTTEVDKDAYSKLRSAYLWELNPEHMLKADVEISMGRHGTMLSIAGLLHDGERTKEEAISILEQLWEKFCTRPPRGRKEIEDIVQHAFSREPCEFEPVNIPTLISSGLVTFTTEEEKKEYEKTSWQCLFHTYEELRDAPPVKFAIEGFLQQEGITILGALPAQGKTLVALAMCQALLEGTPLFGHFNVPEPAQRVVYLIPESGKSPFAHRLRAFRLMKHIESKRMFCRTFSMPGNISLTDPLLLRACQGADVFLDTAIRFLPGDESSSSDQRVFAQTLFDLLAAGARTVTGLHHSAKSSEASQFMTLENILRGSGELGAMLCSCWGLRMCDVSRTKLWIQNVKARDYMPCDPFVVEGRPSIDLDGHFKLTHEPSLAGDLSEHLPRRGNPGGRPRNEEATEQATQILALHAQGVGTREIGRRVGVPKSTVSRLINENAESVGGTSHPSGDGPPTEGL